MSTKSIVVIGRSNTDMIIQLDRIPRPGETLLGGAFSSAAGGKGANQAVGAKLSRREIDLPQSLNTQPQQCKESVSRTDLMRPGRVDHFIHPVADWLVRRAAHTRSRSDFGDEFNGTEAAELNGFWLATA